MLLDLVVDAVVRPRPQNYAPVPASGVQILMMSSGHLGDMLILTFLFPFIQERYPGVQIDVLAGDWCDPVLVNNPYVRRIIHWNHVSTNRKKISGFKKLNQHVSMLGSAVKTLREETYDFSIDIRFSDSPMHQILPFIHVKHSIGFGTRGLGGLLDEELFLPEGEFHHLELLLSLLEKIDVHVAFPDIKPYFTFPANAQTTLVTKLPSLKQTDLPLIVFFPESGASSRFLPVAFWEELLTESLTTTDALIVGCGQLPMTTDLVTRLQAKHPGEAHRLIDATGRLTIDELAALASKATLALTVDSFPAHLCAIFCPLITYYYNGMGIQFFPISNFDMLLFHNHINSRDLLMKRANNQTVFTEEFDSHVVALSMEKVKKLIDRAR